MTKSSYRKGMALCLILAGIAFFNYGCFQIIDILQSSNMILEKIVAKTNPQLLHDPLYQHILNYSSNQSISINVLIYLFPGFVLTGFGSILLFINKIIEHFEGIENVVGEVFRSLVGDDLLGLPTNSIRDDE